MKENSVSFRLVILSTLWFNGGVDRREKIRELQEDLRALDTDIHMLHTTMQKQIAARDGLHAYLEYLRESSKDHDQEPSFPDLRVPDLHPPAHSHEDEKPPATNGHPRKIGVMREVREAVKEIEGEFTQREITQRLFEKYPDASINPAVVVNSLAKMVEREEGIVLWERGSGSAPNVFKKVEDVPSQDNPSQERAKDEDGYSKSNDAEDSFMSD